MLGRTLSAELSAIGGGRDVRANGRSPAPASPVPPSSNDLDPLATYTRYVIIASAR
jgi:hypothetical protein